MDDFLTIRFRRNTAQQRFKRFSKKISSTYTDSKETVLNSFEWHGCLPSEKFKKVWARKSSKFRKV
ncbi:BfmA/BtgA family mobilization protein [Arenibacter nanhaiticus]|uniref:BfmA/BtgA family mobilization protein n=1 Tax=Arenibacter nanhaiticus TaxID=558155 RepID=UPI00373FD401